ncbi:hypothetical protein DOTSEDRAFT_128201 [Dothistroma septosporum NZE10]|uniref:DUF1996 domain-containing protein n=1 Tax=Dothistroma septosporum (strain NZE10 / CBS 128990) TaxID=675120 RepID=N1PP88_DOTSN|nr:hypothetical protein DOTSEDRAFT_128201 [Dothistroma septosporum NZE10]
MKCVASATALLSVAHASQFVVYTPNGDDTVVERADPITDPGQLSGHVHQIFGAVNFAPELDYDSLQQSTCTTISSASGDGVFHDKSSYWHPSLFAESSNATGYVRVPTNGHKIYYRDVGNAADQKASPFEFPAGFRMIAGDMTMRAANSDVDHQGITQWICHGSSQNEGDKGGIPSGVTDCPSYPGFNAAIHFPHCWNGKDFDQSDPTAHVSYPDGDVQGGPCPTSHPIRVPHIFMENQFDLHSVADQVKPDTFVLAQGDPTGFGFHADFFNGWDAGAIPQLIDSCAQGQWGNEDIGTCSAFTAGSTKGADCKLNTSFDENVDTPGKALPGCNPVVSTNPAPKLAVASLGKATTECSAGGSSSSSSSDDNSGSGYIGNDTGSSIASTSAATSAYNAPSSSLSTTLSIAYKSSNTVKTEVANNLAYETVYKTVYAREAVPTPARHGHDHAQHLRRHAKKHVQV